tara:strand:+ start:805 stop:1572 length:768 start_codon:yes stop_codon:yes gene_type:complete
MPLQSKITRRKSKRKSIKTKRNRRQIGSQVKTTFSLKGVENLFDIVKKKGSTIESIKKEVTDTLIRMKYVVDGDDPEKLVDDLVNILNKHDNIQLSKKRLLDLFNKGNDNNKYVVNYTIDALFYMMNLLDKHYTVTGTVTRSKKGGTNPSSDSIIVIAIIGALYYYILRFLFAREVETMGEISSNYKIVFEIVLIGISGLFGYLSREEDSRPEARDNSDDHGDDDHGDDDENWENWDEDRSREQPRNLQGDFDAE